MLLLVMAVACRGEAAPVTTETAVRVRPVSSAAPEAPAAAAAPATTSSFTTTSTTRPPFDPGRGEERMAADLEALLSRGPREAGTAAEKMAADYLEDSLAGILGGVQREEVPLPNGRVSANLWGAVGEGRRVLLGAHYDSVAGSPGADDNGSGTVVLLELARRLAAEPVPGVEVTVAFFGAEEVLAGYGRNSHHYGSRLRARRLQQSGALPDWMVSVDMVGVGERLLAVAYLDTDPGAVQLLRRVGEELEVPVIIISRGDISDHEAFARAGVPAAFLWRPDNPEYHRAGDGVIIPERLAQDLQIIEGFLQAVAAG